MKRHTQGHGQERNHHVQGAAGSLRGIDDKIQWIEEDR